MTVLKSLTTTEMEEEYLPGFAIKEIEEWCEKVENQDIHIECQSYEEYGESYWDRDWSYEYFDVFGMGNELSKAFQVAENLLSHKQYEQSLELYERLCCMSFMAMDNDAEEMFELDLEELVDEDLVSLNLKQISLNLLYAKYQVSEGEERVNTLYRYLTWSMCKNIKMEEIFSAGPEELNGIDRFMEEWISFLTEKDGDLAGGLLSEACMYQGGSNRLAETAKVVWRKHPVLYEKACKQLLNANKISRCEQLGLEAIRVLPEKLIIRGRIADLIAKVAVQLEHFDVMKECYKASFYAESTLNHYLRLFELPEYQDVTNRAAKYAITLTESPMVEGQFYNKQLRVNKLSKDHKKAIRFFNGEFDEIMEECHKDKTTLGWSTQFKGIAVPLFILLLDKNNKLTKAGQRLMDGIDIRLGNQEDEKSFADRFLCWKDKVVITNDQYDKYISWLREEVDKRTQAVVGGGYRKSYHKAAELITALNETMESKGVSHGRTSLIEYYKKLHSRKRAFKAELERLR